LELCRALLALWTMMRLVVGVLAGGAEAAAKEQRCPACGATAWLVVAELPKSSAGVGTQAAPLPAPDSS
jgi:hypothetical protein